jgi:hypothetical protein
MKAPMIMSNIPNRFALFLLVSFIILNSETHTKFYSLSTKRPLSTVLYWFLY